MRVLETASYREVDNSDIHIAEYMTVLPSKEVLEQRLHLAVERAVIYQNNCRVCEIKLNTHKSVSFSCT